MPNVRAPILGIPANATVDIVLRYPVQQLDAQGIPAPEYRLRSTDGGVTFIDLATNLAPNVPASGENDPYPTEPVEVQVTVSAVGRTRTGTMYVLPIQDPADGVFDLSLPVNPRGWVAPASLETLIANTASAKDGALDATARVDVAMADLTTLQAQLLMSADGSVLRYLSETALLGSAPSADGVWAWAADKNLFYVAQGGVWTLGGEGPLTEPHVGQRFARYRPERAETQNVDYLQDLVTGGGIVQMSGPDGEWLLNHAIEFPSSNFAWIGRGERQPLKLSVANSLITVIRNAGSDAYVRGSATPIGSGIFLSDLVLDSNSVGELNTSTRHDGLILMGVSDFHLRRVVARNQTGYGLWFPGSSYGTVVDCTVTNAEEHFEVSEFGHHIDFVRCRAVAGNHGANGFLLYQGAHDIRFLGCSAEGPTGNGFGLSDGNGEVWNVALDAQCRSRMSGPGAAGVLVSAGASGDTTSASGQYLTRADINVTIDGDHRSTNGAAVSSLGAAGNKNTRVIGGRIEGKNYGLSSGDSTTRVRNAHIIAVSDNSAVSPSAITGVPDVADSVLEVQNETNSDRRKLATATAGGRLINVRDAGVGGFIEAHRDATLQNVRVKRITSHYENVRIMGGTVDLLEVSGDACTVIGVKVNSAANLTGAVTAIGNLVAAGGTWTLSHAGASGVGNYVGTVRQADKGLTVASPQAMRVVFETMTIHGGVWNRLNGTFTSGANDGWNDAADEYTMPATGDLLLNGTIALRGGSGEVYGSVIYNDLERKLFRIAASAAQQTVQINALLNAVPAGAKVYLQASGSGDAATLDGGAGVSELVFKRL